MKIILDVCQEKRINNLHFYTKIKKLQLISNIRKEEYLFQIFIELF